MTYGKNLFDYGLEDEFENVKPSIDLGKAVRNASFHSLDPDVLSDQQRILYEYYLMYPEGLTDREAEKIIGIRRSTINARRNELMKMNLVCALGTCYPPDDDGKIGIPNTLWGINTNGGKI